MDKEIEDRLNSFYEQTLIERQVTLKLILDVANTAPDKFHQLIKQQKFDSIEDILTNRLPIFYEALALDLDNWADFFLVEATRLLTLAHKTAAPQKVLTYLDEFTFIKADKFKHRNALLILLSKQLENENVAFRHYASNLLFDFIKPNDFNTINKLRKLLHDPNWRIRYITYQGLRDTNLLSEQDTISWIDKLRARIWSPYSLG